MVRLVQNSLKLTPPLERSCVAAFVSVSFVATTFLVWIGLLEGICFSDELAKNGTTFLVSSSEPYRFAAEPNPAPDPISLSAEQVRRLASQNSAAASLISSNSASIRTRKHDSKKKDQQARIRSLIESAAIQRAQQTSAANAMTIHYGLAACSHANRLFYQTAALLQEQRQVQSLLIEKGIPIPDPLLIDRLTTTLDDERLKNQSRQSLLRIQLSQLIGRDYACGHNPSEPEEISPSDIDVCNCVDVAMMNRCDFVVLQSLRATVREDTLNAWDAVAASLSGLPTIPSLVTHSAVKVLAAKLFLHSKSRSETESAIAKRKQWLHTLSEQRRGQIQIEVELAYEKKRNAALRWAKNEQLIQQWSKRIEQLIALSEAKGNLSEISEAKLQRQQAKGIGAELWFEWHSANEDLALATGTYEPTSSR